MSARRVLTVFVGSMLVEAGDFQPRVGAVMRLPLAFSEDGLVGDPERRIMAVQADLELASDKPRLPRGRRNTERHWQWTGLLRGDGWTATWVGSQPRSGIVEMTGGFSVAPWARGSALGRVTHVSLVSTQYGLSGGAWVPVPDAGFRYEDVDCTPRWPNLTALHATEPNERVIGVLVDLNLDALPRDTQ